MPLPSTFANSEMPAGPVGPTAPFVPFAPVGPLAPVTPFWFQFSDVSPDLQFAVLSITYSDPNGVHHKAVAAASSPLDRYYQTDATPTYDRLWYGKFIIVAPQY